MRVLIVDDHPVTRNGLRAALAEAAGLEIVGEAASGDEAVAEARRLGPDLVLMDAQMPGMNGLEAARTIRGERPDTRVVLLAVEESEAGVAEAMQAGVSGYLVKDVSPSELLEALRQTVAGRTVVHPSLTRALIEQVQLPGSRPPTAALSAREAEILQKIAYGASTKQVARALGISPHTVKTHLERIFEKLGANDRAQAVAIAFRLGLVR